MHEKSECSKVLKLFYHQLLPSILSYLQYTQFPSKQHDIMPFSGTKN